MCTLYELHSGEDTAEEGINKYLYTQHVVYVANGAVEQLFKNLLCIRRNIIAPHQLLTIIILYVCKHKYNKQTYGF